tara:strand:+ start:2053 stop:2352 length:300 start_codon:yes stop_codon:yes gene_type:complete
MEKEYIMVIFTVRVSEYEHDLSYYYPRDYVNSKLDVDLINDFFGRDLTQADSDWDRENSYWDSDRLLEVSDKRPFVATDEQLEFLNKIGVYGDTNVEVQ